jgi:hypothetical protein
VTAAQRRALVISWRLVVLLLVGCAAWQGSGLLAGGDAAYRSAAYDVLRGPGVGPGIRLWGLLLAGLLAGLVTGLRRYSRHGHTALARWALAGLGAWWLVWTAGMILGWAYHGQVFDWGEPAALAVLAALAIAAARALPRMPTRLGGG